VDRQGDLRLLQAKDLASAKELSRLAGWNQTSADWEMMLRLDPLGCFAIEADDQIAATATLLCYGTRLAWIGMVLTRPEYRRLGFAKRLMETALRRASESRIETIKLDATSDGQPLYERLGFKTEQVIERWFKESGGQRIATETPRASHYAFEKDRIVFGTDRSTLLADLALRNAPVMTEDAYCFSREGTRAQYLGPCIAQEQKAARVVIEHALQKGSKTGWFWDLFPQNKCARQLAEEFGFVPKRRLERMVLGKPLPAREEHIYAIAGFELG
jgi:ribosomal protein S18 acetylase RimI-like enzyme